MGTGTVRSAFTWTTGPLLSAPEWTPGTINVDQGFIYGGPPIPSTIEILNSWRTGTETFISFYVGGTNSDIGPVPSYATNLTNAVWIDVTPFNSADTDGTYTQSFDNSPYDPIYYRVLGTND